MITIFDAAGEGSGKACWALMPRAWQSCCLLLDRSSGYCHVKGAVLGTDDGVSFVAEFLKVGSLGAPQGERGGVGRPIAPRPKDAPTAPRPLRNVLECVRDPLLARS